MQCRRHEFDPWVRKILWRREWLSTPVFLPGKFHGQRNLAGYSHGVAKSGTLLNDNSFIFACVLIILRYVPYIPTLIRAFIMKFVKMVFCSYWDYHVVFVFPFTNVMYHIVYIYWTIPFAMKLIQLDYGIWSFKVLLDLVCKYFVEDFYIYIHQRYWPVIFFFVVSLYGFGIRVIVDS